MLMPKRVKHRRVHRGRMKGVATKGNTITYGSFGLVAQECGWITSNQIEAARIAMTRYIKRGGKVYIKIFPHKSVTKKPAEVRMGSGKGSPEAVEDNRKIRPFRRRDDNLRAERRAYVRAGRRSGGEGERSDASCVSQASGQVQVYGQGDFRRGR